MRDRFQLVRLGAASQLTQSGIGDFLEEDPVTKVRYTPF